jgi:hypothetical protein
MVSLRAAPVLVLIFSLAGSALACVDDEQIDRVYGHEHELLDHEYDRREQLAERLFELADEFATRHYDRHLDRHLDLMEDMIGVQLQLFEAVLEAEPPAGFGPSTCTFTSAPSGAEVRERDVHGRLRYVGKTPLVVERPLMHAREIEVRAEGYAPARGWMLSDEVLNPCEEHFVLDRS